MKHKIERVLRVKEDTRENGFYSSSKKEGLLEPEGPCVSTIKDHVSETVNHRNFEDGQIVYSLGGILVEEHVGLAFKEWQHRMELES